MELKNRLQSDDIMTMTRRNRMTDYFVPGSYSFFKPEIVAEKGRGFPLMLNLEPTLVCNLKCFMCPTHNEASKAMDLRSKGHMDFALYEKIMAECAAEGPVLVLNLHKDGESLLHPRFTDMIALAKDSGAAELVHFNTNATFKDDRLIDRILEAGADDITMSVDAVRPETFLKVKGKDLLHVVEANVEKFLKRRDELGSTCWIRVKILGTDDLGDEWDLFRERWEGLADEVQMQRIHNFAGGLDFNREDPDRYACEFPFYSTAVNWDGTVTICHRDFNNTDVFGNVNDQTLREIYTGEKYVRYLKALASNDESGLPICRGCDNWKDGPDLGDDLVKRLIP